MQNRFAIEVPLDPPDPDIEPIGQSLFGNPIGQKPLANGCVEKDRPQPHCQDRPCQSHEQPFEPAAGGAAPGPIGLACCCVLRLGTCAVFCHQNACPNET